MTPQELLERAFRGEGGKGVIERVIDRVESISIEIWEDEDGAFLVNGTTNRHKLRLIRRVQIAFFTAEAPRPVTP